MTIEFFQYTFIGVWETLTGSNFRDYLPWDQLIPEGLTEGATLISILVFFSYAIVLNTVVPISLYVSVEVIRFGLSFLIRYTNTSCLKGTEIIIIHDIYPQKLAGTSKCMTASPTPLPEQEPPLSMKSWAKSSTSFQTKPGPLLR